MSLLLQQFFFRSLEMRMGNERISNILWCAGIVLATLLLKRPLSLLLARLSSGIANHFSYKNQGRLFRELTVKPLELLLQTFLYYIAINQLRIFINFVIFRRQHGQKVVEIRIGDVADKLFLLLLIVFFILVVSRVIEFMFQVLIDKASDEDDKGREQLFPLLKEVIKVLVWTVGAFWVLGAVFNVNIPALVTGLGIGGVAIALAAKESVENLFAAFTILTDKPFQTGDQIKLGSFEGTVERIGFRSTRLRNGEGVLYIIPNKKLVNENLENLSLRSVRKWKVSFNIKYGIKEADLSVMITELKKTVKESTLVLEPVTVLLDSFGENSFQLSVNYQLPDPVTGQLTAEDIRQIIALKAFRVIASYTNSTAVTDTTINNNKEGLPEQVENSMQEVPDDESN